MNYRVFSPESELSVIIESYFDQDIPQFFYERAFQIFFSHLDNIDIDGYIVACFEERSFILKLEPLRHS